MGNVTACCAINRILIVILAPNNHRNNVTEKNGYFAHSVLQVNSYFVLCSEGEFKKFNGKGIFTVF